MQDFIEYAFYGNVIGQSVRTIENVYSAYCKLFGIEPQNEIVNRICNEYGLVIFGGKIQ